MNRHKTIHGSLLVVSVTASVLVTLMAVNYQSANRLWYFGFAAGDIEKSPIARTLVLWASMLLGIVAGHMFRNLKDTEESSLRQIVGLVKRGDFVKALFASPIVFGVVYSAAREQPDLILACVLAFQNGFVCHTIVASLTGEERRADIQASVKRTEWTRERP
jgi:hypothetical protein